MAFVQCETGPRTCGVIQEPIASITSRGEIRFNKRAVTDLGLQEIEFVTLWWDDEEKIIGIKPCKATDKGAFGFRSIRSGSKQIAGRHFFKTFNMELVHAGYRCTPVWKDFMIHLRPDQKPATPKAAPKSTDKVHVHDGFQRSSLTPPEQAGRSS